MLKSAKLRRFELFAGKTEREKGSEREKPHEEQEHPWVIQAEIRVQTFVR